MGITLTSLCSKALCCTAYLQRSGLEMCILALVIVTYTDICFKCQNQQFKVACAATFLQKCESCTLLLEMLFVPHCI